MNILIIPYLDQTNKNLIKNHRVIRNGISNLYIKPYTSTLNQNSTIRTNSNIIITTNNTSI